MTTRHRDTIPTGCGSCGHNHPANPSSPHTSDRQSLASRMKQERMANEHPNAIWQIYMTALLSCIRATKNAMQNGTTPTWVMSTKLEEVASELDALRRDVGKVMCEKEKEKQKEGE